MIEDNILKLILAGYTKYPKKDNPSRASCSVPTETFEFTNPRKALKTIRRLDERGQIIDESFASAKEIYILTRQFSDNKEMWNYVLHPDYIRHFGSPDVFVFDWSGTLSDDRKPVYSANMAMLEKFGIEKMTFDDWLRKTDTTIGQFMHNHGVDLDKEEIHTIYEREYNLQMRLGNFPTVYPDSEEVLQYLKRNGKKIAVISSHPHDNLVNEAIEYSLVQYIDFIDGDARDKKAELLGLAERFCEKPQNMIYIGDMAHDIRAAVNSGMHSVGVSTGYHSKERLAKEKPEFLFDSLKDVMCIRENHAGGLMFVYPTDTPGLFGSPSARQRFETDLAQEDIGNLPRSVQSNGGAESRPLSIME